MVPRFVEERHAELILTVERQRRVDQNAAHGPERQSGDVAILRLVLTDTVDLSCGRQAAISQRQRADTLRGRQVAFEQHRRHAEHVGVVVEARAGIVRRQHRGDVDVEREQIANGIGVLGAIQPVHERPTGIRSCPRRCIERRDQRRQQLVALGDVRPWHSRRRHHAGADFADYLFPDVRMRGDVGKLRAIERQPAGFQLVVVTGDAVGGDDCLYAEGRRRRATGCLLRGAGA